MIPARGSRPPRRVGNSGWLALSPSSLIQTRSTLPVYARQPFPENVLGSGATEPLKSGTEEFRNDEVRVWSLDGEVLIASLKTKMHTISA